MAKNLKIKIKNAQLAKAVKLTKPKKAPAKEKEKKAPEAEAPPQPKRKVKAKARSAFEEKAPPAVVEETPAVEEKVAPPAPPVEEKPAAVEEPKKKATPEQRIGVIRAPTKPKPKPATPPPSPKPGKVREYKELRPKRTGRLRPYDRSSGGRRDDEAWRRRRRPIKRTRPAEEDIVRPSELTIRMPISIKDLAGAMKYKASQLVAKLFAQGMMVTLNDQLDDETVVQLLGHEFGCEITIDTSEEERIRITEQTVREEIDETSDDKLAPRPPVVAFMGHVDHGKTSLIDRIRDTNRAAGEAGAITQHIGAFQCETKAGPIAILDTPGHEAFTAMRARGAEVTDVVVLVVAGDEGIRAQTEEAIQHAKAAGVTILVAINKSDKPDFDAEKVYRQLADLELLPEAWGGSTVTVNCSAVTGEGINELLEMLALQAEVLELKADASARARGSVIESEMHTGLGAIATILVQNGTLHKGDSVVFGEHWGRVKTMRNEFGRDLKNAGPSSPVAITGLSGVPGAGDEFIVVKNEREARHIAEARAHGRKATAQRRRPMSLESALAAAAEGEKKTLKLILRADVQGSLEAVRAAVEKIESDKATAEVIFSGVGAISESDVELAMASDAVILGFHTQVESHADPLIKRHGVQVLLSSVIYEAVDKVKELMLGKLESVAEERITGSAEVLATFKSSALGVIAGCRVKEGIINRNHSIRVFRGDEQIWQGSIASIRREKEDVREVKEGFECGIVLDGFNEVQEGDTLQAFEVVYIAQEL